MLTVVAEPIEEDKIKTEIKLKSYFESKKKKEEYVPPVKRIFTNTTMKMEHFHDFYYLQAMQADLKMRLAQNEELQFSKAVENLEEKLEEACEKVFPNIALRTFVYLYAACFGESRHANDGLAKFRYIPATTKTGRTTLFFQIADYAPTKDNIQSIINAFDQPWKSGYGGTAWLEISKALLLYETIPPAAFIDHVVDLEHNNGTVFSKPDGEDCLYFDIEYRGRFGNFLDYKFRCNILKQQGEMTVIKLSPRVYYLLEKYCMVFHEKFPHWVTNTLDNLDSYRVEWGDAKLFCEEKWLEWAGVQEGNKPTLNMLWSTCGFDEIKLSSMSFEQFEKHIKACTKKAKKIAKKHMTKELKLELQKRIEEITKLAKSSCSPYTITRKYQILPCKIRQFMESLIFQFPVEWEGIGEKREYGIMYIGQSKGINAKWGKENGYDGDKGFHDGYIEKVSGDTVLHIGRERYYYLDPKLEALLD